jgi:hypothetical protein
MLASVNLPGWVRAAEQILERTVGGSAVDDDDRRHTYELANWLKAGQRMVVHLAHLRIDHKLRSGEKKGITIGRSASCSFSSNRLARAGAVLDHNRRTLRSAYLLRQ